VGVDQAQPLSIQMILVYEVQNLFVGRYRHRREVCQELEECLAFAERAEREFADHHRVLSDQGSIERIDEGVVGAMQVVDPDRRINEDHRVRRFRADAERPSPSCRFRRAELVVDQFPARLMLQAPYGRAPISRPSRSVQLPSRQARHPRSRSSACINNSTK
jgi:hypothetical protein